MFTFNLSKQNLMKLMPFCGDYIDIFYRDDRVLIASESGVSYAHYFIEAISLTNDPSTSVRVPTELFSRLAIDGRIEIEKFSTESVISFFGKSNEPAYKYTVPNQISIINFEEKVELLSNLGDYESYNSREDMAMLSLAARLKTDITSLDGFMYVYYNNSYVFTKTKLPSFSCESLPLTKALMLSNKFYVVRGYIVVVNGDVSVIIRKNRLPRGSDIERLAKEKAKLKYGLNIKNLNSIMKSLRSADFDIKLNLTMSSCKIVCSSDKFDVKVPATEFKKEVVGEPDYKELFSNLTKSSASLEGQRIIKLPYWIFKVIGSNDTVELFVKKTCSIIKFNNILLVIGGGLINE